MLSFILPSEHLGRFYRELNRGFGEMSRRGMWESGSKKLRCKAKQLLAFSFQPKPKAKIHSASIFFLAFGLPAKVRPEDLVSAKG